MAVFSTVGARIYIGGALAMKSTDFLPSDFTSQVWVEIKEHETIGTFGDSAEEITFAALDSARIRKLKGVRNAGNLELTCGADYADAGQLALIAAEKTFDDYAIKIEFTDKPAAGASPKNSTRLFIGKVMSAAETIDASSVTKITFVVAINSNVVRVAASAT